MVAKRKKRAKPKKAKRKPTKKRRKAKVARRTKKAKRTRSKKRTLRIVSAPQLEKIGEVTHYFPKVRAAAIRVIKDSIKLGDRVYIKGHTTDFKQNVTSLQLNRAPIETGEKGQEIGLLVRSRTRIGDKVYRL